MWTEPEVFRSVEGGGPWRRVALQSKQPSFSNMMKRTQTRIVRAFGKPLHTPRHSPARMCAAPDGVFSRSSCGPHGVLTHVPGTIHAFWIIATKDDGRPIAPAQDCLLGGVVVTPQALTVLRLTQSAILNLIHGLNTL
jgi:hypothetical protein